MPEMSKQELTDAAVAAGLALVTKNHGAEGRVKMLGSMTSEQREAAHDAQSRHHGRMRGRNSK